MRFKILAALFFLFMTSLACSSVEDLPEQENKSFLDTKEVNSENGFKGWKEGLACQGSAIFKDIIYVARSSGVCDRYSLKDKDVKYISSSNFQSSGSTNHANCIQFDYCQHRDADPIMYISTHYRTTPCYVETITERGSEMLQYIYRGVGRSTKQYVL